MSVKKRKGSPFYWYDFTVRGNRFRGSTETDDLATAKAIEAKLRTDALLMPILGKAKEVTNLNLAFGRYWLEYAQYLKSADVVKYHVAHLLKHLGKSKNLDEIRDNDIAKYKAKRRAKVSDSTVNRELCTLSSMMRKAREEWEYKVSDVNIRKHLMKEPEARTRWITIDEAEKLIECAAEHLKAPIRFALLTGVRLSNVTRLQWKQVNLRHREISFQIKSNIPGGKNLVLPMSDQLLILLNNQKKKGKEPKPEDFVFTYRGKDIKKFRKSFKTACEKAGIENFRFHDLRHTAASWMVQSGIPIDLVQEILGHTKIETTKKYAHRQHGEKVKALQMVATSQIRHNKKKEEIA